MNITLTVITADRQITIRNVVTGEQLGPVTPKKVAQDCWQVGPAMFNGYGQQLAQKGRKVSVMATPIFKVV